MEAGRAVKRLLVAAVLVLGLVLSGPAAASISTFAGVSAGDVAVDGQGRVLVADPDGHQVARFTAAGDLVDRLGEGTLTGSTLSVAAGGAGQVAVSRAGDNRFTLFGVPGGPLTWGTTGNAGAGGVGIDGAGAIYGLEGGTRVVKYDDRGARQADWAVTDATGEPIVGVDLAVEGDTIAVIGHRSAVDGPPFVAVYSSAGVLRFAWTKPSLTFATHVALDAAGSVYVSDRFSIQVFTQDGQAVDSVSTATPPVMDPRNGFCYPSYSTTVQPSLDAAIGSLAIGSSGELYVTDTERRRVLRIDRGPLPVFGIAPAPEHRPGTPWETVTGSRQTFDATGSRAPLSRIVRHEWDFDGDGVFDEDTGSDPRVVHYYAADGSFTVRLRETAENGLSATAAYPIVVKPSRAYVDLAGEAPRPAARAVAGDSLRLTAIRSMLWPCGEGPRPLTWDLDGDGTFELDLGTQSTVTATFPTVGAVRVRVRVARPGGRIDVGELPVDVRPAPPAGPSGVSIEDEAAFVNDPEVTLDLVWPKYANRVLVSNDGGFRRAQSFELGERVPWRLASSGPERQPKTVYVRFAIPEDETATDRTYTDDVVLDETVPVLTAARRVRRRVTVTARDKLSGAGAVQIAVNRKKPGKRLPVARKLRGKRSFTQAFAYTGRSRPWVRVLDRAGNASRWRRAGG
jgi:hypothetical protein